MAQIFGLKGPSSYQRYEDESKFKKDTLPTPIVSRLARRLEGKGDPPITREEVWELSGVLNDFGEITRGLAPPSLGIKSDPAGYLGGILRAGSAAPDKDFLMLLSYIVSETLPAAIMPKKAFNTLCLLLIMHDAFKAIKDELLDSGRFTFDRAVELLDEKESHVQVIMGMAFGIAEVLRAVETENR